jgi:hypothetical protein
MKIGAIATSSGPVQRATVNRGIFDGSEQTDCELKKWWFAFQAAAAKQSIPLRVHNGYRDKAWQNRLEAEGHSNAKWGQSPHNFGLAVDIIHTTRAWVHMPAPGWDILGALGQEVARRRGLKLTWGGDPAFGFYDPAHWQYSDWRLRAARLCPAGMKCIAKDGKVICGSVG